jgi:CRP-like cAMP-binding protein
VQIPGEADRVDAAAFVRLLDRLPILRRLLLRYTVAFITQIAQGSACNRAHPIEARCARWLLMTHDRVDSDDFPLTQEFLGQMLGVTRPSVSIAANMLQKAGLIRYVRGQITILDRAGLEAALCECYDLITREFRRVAGTES